jgi:hypothetical protein
VPDAPPEAGPDRAFDPRPPAEPLPGAVAEGEVAVAEDVPQATESPIIALISAAIRIHRRPLFAAARKKGWAEAVSQRLVGS